MSGSESSDPAGIVTAICYSNAHRKGGDDNIYLHWIENCACKVSDGRWLSLNACG